MKIAFRPKRPAPDLVGPLILPKIAIGGPTVTLLPPTSSSKGGWSFVSSNNDILLVIGNTARALAPGSVAVTAIQNRSGVLGTGETTTCITIKPPQNDMFGAFVIPNKTIVDQPFKIVPPASLSTGKFTYSSSDPSIISVVGNTATIHAVGTCSITASQEAAGIYKSGNATCDVTVTLATPTVGALSVPDQAVNSSSFQLVPPVSNSTGAWTFMSSDASIMFVNGRMATPLNAGVCTITAVQAATNNYEYGRVTALAHVIPVVPTLGTFTIPYSQIWGAPFQITPPVSNSNGTWTFTSSDSSIISINGNIASIGAMGTCVITAVQAATHNYLAASVTATATVTAMSPTIQALSIPVLHVDGISVHNPYWITNPVSNSGGEFSYFSSDQNVATVNGNWITAVAPGTFTLTAIQKEFGSYLNGTVKKQISVV